MKIRIIAFSLVLVLASCAKRVPPTNSFEAKGLRVGKVQLSTGALPADREQRADRIELETQVRDRTLETLRSRNLFDPTSGITMAIHIEQFRLRSGATRYFTGFFSGSDNLGAALTVSDGSNTLLSKKIEVSGGNGNPFAISSRSRGANLSNDLANLAVTSLQQDAILYAPLAAQTGSSGTAAKVKSAEERGTTSKASACSIDQVLALKAQKFSDLQIKKACDEVR